MLIKDSEDARGKIDGYIATVYTPIRSGQMIKKLRRDTRFFTFDDLQPSTIFVVEVSSYKANAISNRSPPIKVQTPNAGSVNI